MGISFQKIWESWFPSPFWRWGQEIKTHNRNPNRWVNLPVPSLNKMGMCQNGYVPVVGNQPYQLKQAQKVQVSHSEPTIPSPLPALVTRPPIFAESLAESWATDTWGLGLGFPSCEPKATKEWFGPKNGPESCPRSCRWK